MTPSSVGVGLRASVISFRDLAGVEVVVFWKSHKKARYLYRWYRIANGISIDRRPIANETYNNESRNRQ